MYIGNSQFIGEKHIALLDKIIKEVADNVEN
jgi:hypothetical protein